MRFAYHPVTGTGVCECVWLCCTKDSVFPSIEGLVCEWDARGVSGLGALEQIVCPSLVQWNAVCVCVCVLIFIGE